MLLSEYVKAHTIEDMKGLIVKESYYDEHQDKGCSRYFEFNFISARSLNVDGNTPGVIYQIEYKTRRGDYQPGERQWVDEGWFTGKTVADIVL